MNRSSFPSSLSFVLLIIYIFFLVSVASSFLHSSSSSSISSFSYFDDVHTWNNFTSLNGTWHVAISVVNQRLSFVCPGGYDINGFTVKEGDANSQLFGMVLDPSDDFNVMFILTAIQQPSNSVDSPVSKDLKISRKSIVDKPMLSQRACVFMVSAYSAAEPQVSTYPYFGNPKCNFVIDASAASVNFTAS